MKMQNDMALPLRAIRRNRMILAIGGVLAVSMTAAIALTSSGRLQHSPLLVAVDEMIVPPAKHVREAVASRLVAEPETLNVPAPTAFVVDTAPAPAQEEAVATINPTWRMFDGRPIRPVRTITMVTTAYSPDVRSCGVYADGITASGYSVWTNGMKLAAADTSVLPFGSMISVPGYDDGEVIPVLDRGGAINGNRLDLLFATHEVAMQWGRQKLEVTIWEFADGKPNGFRTKHR